MSEVKNSLEYERVEQEVPAAFPWIAIVKLAVAVVAIPIVIFLFWLLVLIGYWFKYGKWAGWNASLGS